MPVSSRPLARGAALLCCVSALLAGCGGGDKPSAAAAPGRAYALAVVQPSAVGSVTPGSVPGVGVDALVMVAQRRITRTVFEYDYRLTLRNTGVALSGVSVQLSAAGAGTSIVEPTVNAGTLAAGATTPADTLTLRHDRTLPFLPAQLSWTITAPSVITGTVAVGAALANADVSVIDSGRRNVCSEPRIVTNGTGGFTCTVLAGRVAPFVVVVTDASGAYPPLVSIVGGTPLPGQPLVANATPLTTALVGQLAGGNALSVVANPGLIDLDALARVTAKVLAQVQSVLAALNVPAGYDPFSTPIQAATPTQSGNTADQVLELLRLSTVNGVPTVATVDNPQGGVPLAGPDTTNPPVLPPPTTTVLDLAGAMPLFTAAYNECFALPVASRVLAVDTSIPYSAGGATVSAMAPACRAIAHPDYLNSGYTLGQRLYGLLRDERMVGARFSLPELMVFTDDTTAADNDRAVLNLRYIDNNGVSGNLIENARKLPGSASAARRTDWWIYGNQGPVDAFVRAVVRRSEQLAPNPGTAPFQNTGASRYESAIEMFVNKDGPGSTGLRAARVRGPGLPAAGVVLTRPDPAIATNQTWLSLRRKDGLTDPAFASFANTTNNNFKLQRTQGLDGSAAGTTRPNPFAGSSNNTAFPDWAHPLDYGAPVGTPTENYIDFSSLGPHNTYVFEIFYNGETTPRHTLTRTMLTAVLPATYARNLELD